MRGDALLATSAQNLRVNGRLTSCVSVVNEAGRRAEMGGPIGSRRSSEPWAALVRRDISSKAAAA